MNLDPENGHTLDQVIPHLAETIAWCSSRPRPWWPATTFRSADIAPEFGSRTRKASVQSVAEQRRCRLGGGTITFPKIYSFHGRLLAFFPDGSLDCGVAASETDGFFTDGNVPPWDTWVAYLQEDHEASYILAWVPRPMVHMVDAGLRLIPEQCVEWVDERRPYLIEALAARGLRVD
ncbi:hypothetical protein [Bradyrhizobium sp. SZCCHNRI3043]|uniref:hypothetical protein n=1 Tax=Bradyrhizobium sp. SZCCHNRI3043 TaxID=3057292 RepID=UPI0028E6EF2A|nr:hypothetical protein [Bradyrhizobium sp. SZCCHNRI3043]